MANKIIFTKLGTVKKEGGTKELQNDTTYKDFFHDLRESIIKNVQHFSVIHYDDSDKYTIRMTDSMERLYDVYYGDLELSDFNTSEEITKELDILADLTKKKETEIKKKKVHEELERKKTEKAVRNGDKGIFDSVEDKERYIDYLKKAIVEKKNKIKHDISKYPRTKYTYGGKRYGTHFIVGFLDLAATVALGLIGSANGFLSFHQGLTLPNFALIVKGAIDATSLLSAVISFNAGGYHLFGEYGDSEALDYEDDFMMHSTTYFLVVGLINAAIAAKNAGSFIINAIKTRLGFNRFKKDSEIKIASLEKSLAKDRLHEKTKAKEKGNEKEEEKVDLLQEAKTAIEQSIRETRKEFNDLFQKIKSIVDRSKKREYYDKLLKMVDDYQEQSKGFEQNGNHLAINQFYMNQMSSLGYLVDKQLASEHQQQKSNEEFAALEQYADEVAKEGHQSTR